MKASVYIVLIFIVVISSCEWDSDRLETESSETKNVVPLIRYSVRGSFAHDTNSFTEGFFIHAGKFYESTGGTSEFSNTKSLFGILDTVTGQIDKKAELNKERFFGEGIALLNNKIYQLTYKSRIGFVYDAKSYKEIKQFSIPTEEGWGLTTNGQEIIMSNGTNELLFLEPENLQLKKKLSVTQNGYAVDRLNELEYINGAIYANVFTSNTIVKINSKTGIVEGKMDLSSLFYASRGIYPGAIDMNGIAYDSASSTIYVTGKFWPKVYALSLQPKL